MHLDVFVNPTDVSFYRVQGIEVGEDATSVWGYFTNFSTADLSHKNNGADVPFQIQEDNQWQEPWDNAYEGDNNVDPPPWTGGGGYTWNIPGAWFIPGSSTNSMQSQWQQIITLNSTGTMTITKFGHWVQRTTNDVITSY